LLVLKHGAVMHPAYGACVQPVWPIPLVGTQSKLKAENTLVPGIKVPLFIASQTGAEFIVAQRLPSVPHLAIVFSYTGWLRMPFISTKYTP
jgi:hypothetical protein